MAGFHGFHVSDAYTGYEKVEGISRCICFSHRDKIFTHTPNLGKPGYVTEIGDFLPGSTKVPQKVYIPKPKGTEPKKHAWEED